MYYAYSYVSPSAFESLLTEDLEEPDPLVAHKQAEEHIVGLLTDLGYKAAADLFIDHANKYIYNEMADSWDRIHLLEQNVERHIMNQGQQIHDLQRRLVALEQRVNDPINKSTLEQIVVSQAKQIADLQSQLKDALELIEQEWGPFDDLEDDLELRRSE